METATASGCVNGARSDVRALARTIGVSCAPTTRELPLRRSVVSTRVSLLCGIVAMLVASAAPACAQNIFQRLDLDRLSLQGFGAVVGPVSPSPGVSTQSYGVPADYGGVPPPLRGGFLG